MTETVGNVCNEVEILTLLATKKAINSIDNNLDDVNILPFVEATDVVCFCYLTIVEDGIDSSCVIHYIQPIAYILALAIDREGLAMTDVINEEWYLLFGELIRTIVVGAIGHDSWHTVCVVEGTNKVIRTSL